jgi:hypothetical protein
MERRFRVRLDELLDDAQVRPSLLRGVLPRLESFLQPFVAVLQTPERQTNARHYVQGLLSDLDGKDIESITYLHDRERQGLQKFIGQTEWDHQPLLAELVRHVATELGEPDGVLVFDPSAFPKKGTESVGVQRQWCGRLGKIEKCQAGYPSSRRWVCTWRIGYHCRDSVARTGRVVPTTSGPPHRRSRMPDTPRRSAPPRPRRPPRRH